MSGPSCRSCSSGSGHACRCIHAHQCGQHGARHAPHLRPPPKTSDWLVLCSQSGTDSVPEPRPSCSPHALSTAALGIATAASEWLTLVASDLRSERKRLSKSIGHAPDPCCALVDGAVPLRLVTPLVLPSPVKPTTSPISYTTSMCSLSMPCSVSKSRPIAA